MLLRKKILFLQGLLVMSIGAALLGSCGDIRPQTPGGKELPDRPTFPEDHMPILGKETNGQTELSNFAISYLDIPVSGNDEPFVVVQLPTLHHDTLANELLYKYQLLSGTLISQWAKKHTGVVLDLSTTKEGLQKTDFRLAINDAAFPLVLIWDKAAADRADIYANVIKKLPGIAVSEEVITPPSLFEILPADKDKRPMLQNALPETRF
jgi:hypothetical protein